MSDPKTKKIFDLPLKQSERGADQVANESSGHTNDPLASLLSTPATGGFRATDAFSSSSALSAAEPSSLGAQTSSLNPLSPTDSSNQGLGFGNPLSGDASSSLNPLAPTPKPTLGEGFQSGGGLGNPLSGDASSSLNPLAPSSKSQTKGSLEDPLGVNSKKSLDPFNLGLK